MRRVVVGTAGHIDHGKTALIQALTGIDCDRWREEKERGITIDLGFAHLERGDLQVGFVDVPGHERFLHNALAGLGGIRIMLLVISADEGVMPQTREHLAICSLLGIPAGIVALTKSDLVAPDLLELARLEAEELLAATPFAGAAVLPVSARTGAGVPELEAALLDLAGRWATDAPDPDRPMRLPVDRAFHLKGLGVIVTGTLASGAVAPGDALELLPGTGPNARGTTARVRSVQVHGAPHERAEAGERTSLQLTGVELSELARGAVLAEPAAYAGTRRLAVRCTILPEAPAPLTGWTPVRLHLFSARVLGELRPLGTRTIEPGETAEAELRLAAPVVAVRGDRFVLRRPSPQTTLGGGEVLDPGWKRPRAAALPQALAALRAGRPETLVLWVREAGEPGAGDDDLARRLGLRPAAIAPVLAELAAAGRLLEAPAGHGHGRRWIAPGVYRQVADRARRELTAYFERDRLAPGMPKAEAVRRILPRGAELAEVYLRWLAVQGVLTVAGDLINPPGREAELSGAESALARRLAERFAAAGLEAPSPAELAAELGAKREIVDGVVRWLLDRGRLVRLPGGLLISSAAIETLTADLAATGWDRFTVPQFKDRFGLTRKWAIPLLEHLDSTGRTRRLGDQRQVVRRPAQ